VADLLAEVHLLVVVHPLEVVAHLLEVAVHLLAAVHWLEVVLHLLVVHRLEVVLLQEVHRPLVASVLRIVQL
jgi:hypothetical protein